MARDACVSVKLPFAVGGVHVYENSQPPSARRQLACSQASPSHLKPVAFPARVASSVGGKRTQRGEHTPRGHPRNKATRHLRLRALPQHWDFLQWISRPVSAACSLISSERKGSRAIDKAEWKSPGEPQQIRHIAPPLRHPCPRLRTRTIRARASAGKI